MFLSLKTLYRKRTVIWPFYFYTIIRTLSLSILGKIIALTSVVLFMLKMIPANGIIQWSMLLVAIILIFIGNKFE